jgi:hypothetical protein
VRVKSTILAQESWRGLLHNLLPMAVYVFGLALMSVRSRKHQQPLLQTLVSPQFEEAFTVFICSDFTALYLCI